MACYQNGCCGDRDLMNAAENRCHQLGPIRAIDQNCILPVDGGGRGAIIPYASGAVPLALVETVGGALASVPFLVGFGTAFPGVLLANGTINLSTTIAALNNEAFVVPRAGAITSLFATFTVLAAVTLGANNAVVAEVYRAPEGSTVFSPTGVRVNLAPTVPGLIAVGTLLSGSVTADFPVAAGDRLLLVYSLSGTTLATAFSGSGSAGMAIE
ncbi:exosporium glycoprotein BclB-related protein [Sporosarcina cyprini]|uniref:exosporium glycoprotein BclB-related protein n=1 Tax=Sporosarcina cyprini TaxID=2910523 RepID=UPI001EDD93C9|nr:exosporium glycoprotein BclB-related protein [Sporosarcina cyprini]MCG3087210.1 hypothetical protein [Sporosarcina cyprini]